MGYLVSLTARAVRDLSHIYEQIHASDSRAALAWYRGLQEAILSLEEFPLRCAVTPESQDLRHLLYGNKPDIYRVIYRVREKQRKVDVLHIRAGAQRPLRGGEIS